MRYVIAFAAAGFFLAWDLVSNRGEHTADLVHRIARTAAWMSF